MIIKYRCAEGALMAALERAEAADLVRFLADFGRTGSERPTTSS